MDPEQHENRNERTDDRSRDAGSPASVPRDEAPGDGASPQRRGNRHHMGRRKNRSRQAAERAAAGGNGTERNGDTLETRGAMASGRTPGVKASEDPATAPLGTDDEAAGTPASVQATEHETAGGEQERGRVGLTAAEAMDGRPGHPEESPRNFGKLVTIAAAIIIALIVWMVMF